MASKAEEKDTTTDLPEGWVLVHEQEETTEPIAGQGVLQVTPAVYRAEKQLNGTLVNAQGATPEELALAARAIEASVAAFKVDPVGAPATEPPTFTNEAITEGEPDTHSEEVEVNLNTVVTADGTFTEEEWAGRSRTDIVVTEDGQTIFAGVGEQTEDIDAALEQTAAEAATAANEATTDPHAGTETKQITYDTADAIDSPGQSAGGTLVIPAEAEDKDEAAAAMTELSAKVENERTADEQAKPAEKEASKPSLEKQIAAEKAKAEKKK